MTPSWMFATGAGLMAGFGLDFRQMLAFFAGWFVALVIEMMG